MSNDRYQEIRDALAMGPTSGPWEWKEGQSAITRKWDGKEWPIASVEWSRLGWHENRRCESLEAGANAALIAACAPDTIRELLAERDQLAAALEAAREDTERLAFLASEPVVEGFVGDEKDIYDYACDAAEESGRDEPSEADMLAGLRRMIDAARAAIARATKEGQV